jgi:hypothetical protein
MRREGGEEKGPRAVGVGPAGRKPSKGGRREKFLSFLFFRVFKLFSN